MDLQYEYFSQEDICPDNHLMRVATLTLKK